MLANWVLEIFKWLDYISMIYLSFDATTSITYQCHIFNLQPNKNVHFGRIEMKYRIHSLALMIGC